MEIQENYAWHGYDKTFGLHKRGNRWEIIALKSDGTLDVDNAVRDGKKALEKFYTVKKQSTIKEGILEILEYCDVCENLEE